MADIYRAREAFSIDSRVGGIPRTITAGTLMPSDDPDFKGRERFFELAEEFVARKQAASKGSGAVETATAAPGETRHAVIKRPAKKVEPKPPESKHGGSGDVA